MDFVMRLRPVKYQLIDGQSGRYHRGLIAQEYKQVLLDSNLSTIDDATYVESDYVENVDGIELQKTIRSLRYEELIPLLISSIQNLNRRVSILDGDSS